MMALPASPAGLRLQPDPARLHASCFKDLQTPRLSGSRILPRHFDHLERLTVPAKQRSDFVSEAGLQAEREIIQTLRKTYPNHGILAEEGTPQSDR